MNTDLDNKYNLIRMAYTKSSRIKDNLAVATNDETDNHLVVLHKKKLKYLFYNLVNNDIVCEAYVERGGMKHTFEALPHGFVIVYDIKAYGRKIRYVLDKDNNIIFTFNICCNLDCRIKYVEDTKIILMFYGDGEPGALIAYDLEKSKVTRVILNIMRSYTDENKVMTVYYDDKDDKPKSMKIQLLR